MNPQSGEVWHVDLGMIGKPRWAMVISQKNHARLAIASVVLITTQFAGTPYELTLPRVPWLREQSYINAQSIQPVKLSELTRKAPGQFDASIISEVKAIIRKWLEL